MTIKQQIIHGAIQKVCLLHNDTFHSIPFHLCHILSIYYLPILCYSLKITKYGIREYKIFCKYGSFNISYHVISKELKVDTTAFLDTHVCIKKPY